MEEIKLTGDYEKITKRKFTRKELLDIREKIIEGQPIFYISRKYKVDRLVIQELFREFILTMDSIKNKKNKTILGNRDCTYYTEAELLENSFDYTWEELSKSEKNFYLNYGKRKKRNSRYDNSLE